MGMKSTSWSRVAELDVRTYQHDGKIATLQAVANIGVRSKLDRVAEAEGR